MVVLLPVNDRNGRPSRNIHRQGDQLKEFVLMKNRRGLSKKARFDVFKRDGFACQYCGATPPSVLLHIDHIVPVAEGGENDQDNLITACEACNLGKGAGLLSDIPKSLRERAAEALEKEEQIRCFNEILQSKARRLEDESWAIACALECNQNLDSYSRRNLLSIKTFLSLLPFQEVLDSAEIAISSGIHDQQRAFRYFCGVCWAKIRGQKNASR